MQLLTGQTPTPVFLREPLCPYGRERSATRDPRGHTEERLSSIRPCASAMYNPEFPPEGQLESLA
jgi:hypothetical protein